ncbi:recombinase family protein [Streptomyces sp. ISL-22]|uniref:recombinase family protein n=1 Tax=unclassified Streptomyces TaxID=2593676 RepID=UPI001BE4F7E4|nr:MULTISPECIES: recombinase family protein [unclassified Streptomyces]MBT2420571.1 recombinase family protein [Streptomyces sp. ISL-24]MBT2438260.1 recombinase family protein [Streptomyces sp. ISL-22]
MVKTAAAQLTGREYLRVSFDHSGDERSPAEQHDENAEAAAEFNITLGAPYTDVGSASRYARKERDDFNRLMADLRSGRFGADVLQLWEGSRGSRKPREWLDLIDVCEECGIKILITTHGRLYDLSRWRDRHTLKEEALKAEAEAEQTRERVLRALNSNLASHKLHSKVPFGYEREYKRVRNSRNKTVLRPVRQFPSLETAPYVVELFQRVKKGHPLITIERDWRERGISERTGETVATSSLMRIARNVAYIGTRIHNGQELKDCWPVISEYKGSEMTADEFRTLFRQVQQILDDPERTTTRPGGARHVLTGRPIRCGECGGPIRVARRRDEPERYECRLKACAQVDKAAVDTLLIGDLEPVDAKTGQPLPPVLGVLLSFLSRPDVYDLVTPASAEDDAELRDVRAELGAKRTDLKETQATEPESLAHESRLARREQRLEAQIAELEAREAKLTRPNPLAALFPPDRARDVVARWKALGIAVQRKIAALLFTPELLGEARIVKGRGLPVEQRIVRHRARAA